MTDNFAPPATTAQGTAAAPTLSPQSDASLPPATSLRLVLMGTGPFAVPAFSALLVAGYEVPLVVTRPQRVVKSRKGPPPAPVRQLASDHGLELYDPPSINAPDAIARLQAMKADLFVVCDYGQILSATALEAARLGGINLHGSLLPRYRGAAPVQWAVLSGDSHSGISVIHMTPRLDGGPILAMAKTEILPHETAGDLEQRLALLGVQPTLDSVRTLAAWDGQAPLGQPQDPAAITRAPRLEKSQGQIDWSRPAEEIDWHVRGMQPWPGAWTDLQAGDRPAVRVAIRAVTVLTDANAQTTAPEAPAVSAPAVSAPGATAAGTGGPFQPGQWLPGDQLVVATGAGVLRVDRLQVAGRSEVDGASFLRGTRLPAGSRFGVSR